jgi:TolB-like protein/DNA-binding winged helix-turn-helix (wHTH) protein/Tfp pilus assembly protein PilF
MPANDTPHRYQLADLTLDVAQRRVSRQGRPIELSALTFDLLRTLVESAPNVVTCEDLAEKVWGRHFVSPENVAQRVMMLRQGLSDDANQPRYIETVRGKGYRLIASVQTETAPERIRRRPPRWAAAAALVTLGLAAGGLFWLGADPPAATDPVTQATFPNSVAVLPFKNLSPDPEDAYFAAGIRQEIIWRLGRTPNVNVLGWSSMERYADSGESAPEIGKRLHVETVMEGSVHYSGDLVRITVNLVDSVTGISRWSNAYDGNLLAVFDIQDKIATNIATELGAAFFEADRESVEPRPTSSPEAFALYLKVLDLDSALAVVDRTERLRLLDQALQFDPNFSHAYALKAEVYAYSVIDWSGGRAGDTDPVEAARLALANANKALELDSSSWRAYKALAEVHRNYWRWGAARDNFAKAHELAPTELAVMGNYSWLLSWSGRHDEAIRLAQRALQLNPTSAAAHGNLGMALAQAGRTALAAAAFRAAASIAPDNGLIRHWLGQMEGILGNREAALAELRAAERLTSVTNPALSAGLLYSYSRIDAAQDAARLFAEVEKLAAEVRVGAGTWALAHLAIGDAEQALQWLNVAVEKIENQEPDAGTLNLLTIKSNLHANPVLDEPRFRDLRDKIGAR